MTARDTASSRPSSRRDTSARLAQGQARLTTSRYRPASTGHPSRPSAVIRSWKCARDRLNAFLPYALLPPPASSRPPMVASLCRRYRVVPVTAFPVFPRPHGMSCADRGNRPS